MPPKNFSVDESTFCKTCNLSFANYNMYHEHKTSSIRHITCDKCSMDFRTDAALKSHHDLQHAAEQRLPCPGCTKVFTRLGSLMSHIELGECSPIEKAKVEAIRKLKEKWNVNYRAAHNNKDIIRNGESAFEQPHPFAISTIATPQMQAQPIRVTATMNTDVLTTLPTTNNVAFAQGDDLMSFDEIGSILNSPWDNSVPTSREPFPNQTTSPPTGVFIGLNLKEPVPDIAWDEHDSASPTFNASKYYVDVLRKYKCPKYPCNKSFGTKSTFIAHLKSPAHHNEKLQCHNCFRYFQSATALTQHCEAQGVRCKVRDTTGYNGIVDEVTGGTARISGRHVDNTVKYAVNNENLGVQGAITAHRAAMEVREENISKYWTSEKLDNHKW